MVISIQHSAVWLTALLFWTRGPVTVHIMLWAGLSVLLIRVKYSFLLQIKVSVICLPLSFQFSCPKYSICFWSMHTASVGKLDFTSSGSHHFCCSRWNSVCCCAEIAVCSQGPEHACESSTFLHPTASWARRVPPVPTSPPSFRVTLDVTEWTCNVLFYQCWCGFRQSDVFLLFIHFWSAIYFLLIKAAGISPERLFSFIPNSAANNISFLS